MRQNGGVMNKLDRQINRQIDRYIRVDIWQCFGNENH